MRDLSEGQVTLRRDMAEPQNLPIRYFSAILERRKAADPERLMSDAEAVSELMAHRGWAVLEQLLREQIAHVHQQIVGPLLRDEREYVAVTRQEFALGEVLLLPQSVLEMSRRVIAQREREAAIRAAREQA